VALFATGGKACCGVTGSGSLLVGRSVARVALEGQTLELAHRGAFVAVRALQGSVTTDQREAILVIADSLKSNLPTLDRVAALAVRAHLPVMDISMTVGAASPCIRENRLRVALRAGQILVQASQGKGGPVVIEFGNRTDRFPAELGMAILAGDVQVAVRTARDRRLARLSERQQRRDRDHQRAHNTRRHCPRP